MINYIRNKTGERKFKNDLCWFQAITSYFAFMKIEASGVSMWLEKK